MMWSSDRIRGGLAGVTCGILAFAAHGIERDSPNSAALMLVLLVSGVVGAVVGCSAGRGRLWLFGMLALGQLLGHTALASTEPPRPSHPSEISGCGGGWIMLAAHAAATMLCALLIAAAERLYRAVAGLVSTLLSTFSPRPALDAPLSGVRYAADRRDAILLRGAISRRGPPFPLPVVVAA